MVKEVINSNLGKDRHAVRMAPSADTLTMLDSQLKHLNNSDAPLKIYI